MGMRGVDALDFRRHGKTSGERKSSVTKPEIVQPKRRYLGSELSP